MTPSRHTIPVLLAGGLAVLTACGTGVSTTAGSTTTAASSATVANCGRNLAVTEPPAAVVGLSPAQTELLLRLGLRDSIVGQAQTDTAPLPDDLQVRAADIPVLSEQAPPTREILLGAEPDFVYAPTSYEFTAEQGFASQEQLDQAGVQSYIATGGCADRRMSGTVQDLFTDLDNLGVIFDVQDEAAELIDQAQAQLDDVTERIDGLDRPTVAQVYVEAGTISAIGAGIEYDMIRAAGGDNVFGPEDPAFAEFFAAQIGAETLAAKNPDAVVFSVHDEAHEQATRDFLTSTFPEIDAVRHGRLIAVSGSDVHPGTLGNIEAVRQIAEGLYPEVF